MRCEGLNDLKVRQYTDNRPNHPCTHTNITLSTCQRSCLSLSRSFIINVNMNVYVPGVIMMLECLNNFILLNKNNNKKRCEIRVYHQI